MNSVSSLRNRALRRGVRPYGHLLLCVAVLVLPGCSLNEALDWVPGLQRTVAPQSTPSPVPTSTPTSPPSPDATPTTTPSGARFLTLTLWVPDILDPNVAETGAAPVGEQAARFATASSSIDVEVLVKQGSGPGGLYELLRTAKGVAPAVVPDLLILNHVDLIAAAREGLLQPLDAYLPPDSGYFPTALDSVSTAEALWAFPYVATAEQMAYIATDAVTPTPPITWTGILSGSYAMALPGAPVDGLASDVLLSMYMGSGGRVLDDKSLPTLERATLRQVYGFLLELRSAGLLDADQVLGIADTAGCWNALLVEDSPSIRLAPVAVSEYWRPSLATLAGVGIEETPQPESTRPANIRPSWAPTESGDPITVMRTWGLAVTTEDPVRLDAALELIRWLVSAQHMADLTRTAAVVPTRRQAVETWGLAADQEAFLLALLSSGVSPPVDGAEVVVRRALQSGLTALLQGEAPTADAAASQALASLRR